MKTLPDLLCLQFFQYFLGSDLLIFICGGGGQGDWKMFSGGLDIFSLGQNSVLDFFYFFISSPPHPHKN